MSSGLIGKKIGMTSIFDAAGNSIPCTVIEAGPNVVTQVKTADGRDGYNAVQLSFAERREKRTPKAMKGHFAKAQTTPKRAVVEFRDFEEEVELGSEARVEDIFTEGDIVDVVGTSKGRGFQGVVRRHGFGGVGSRTHGQHNRGRAPGSIGASSFPSRVVKGLRMAGHMGHHRVKIKNLEVVRILPDHQVILIRGAVPGPKNGFVEIHRL
jgi:large subunit ribosomal protein L3